MKVFFLLCNFNPIIIFMFEILQAYFEREFSLTKDDIALIRSVFLPKQLKKGEFLLREGEVAKYGAFVAKGILRSNFR